MAVILPKGPAAPIKQRPTMNVPIFFAKAFTKAPTMRITEPTANDAFRPHRELMAELIYGVTMAALDTVSSCAGWKRGIMELTKEEAGRNEAQETAGWAVEIVLPLRHGLQSVQE